MEKFVADLATPYWWISVALVGIAINLLSSYLKRPLDRMAVAAFQRYKEKKQLQGEAFENASRELSLDSDARVWMFQEEARLYFKCVRRTLLGIWLMTAGIGMAVWASKLLIQEAMWLRYLGDATTGFGLLLWINAGSVYQQAYARSALLRRAREIQIGDVTVGEAGPQS